MKTTITIELESNGLLIDFNEARDKLAAAMDKANDENRKKIDEMIDFSMKYKILIQLAQEQYRGLGKTTQLAIRAQEYGVPLIVPNETLKRYVEGLGFNRVVHFSRVEQTYGREFEDGFLVDEGVNPKIISALCEHSELLGGFSRV